MDLREIDCEIVNCIEVAQDGFQWWGFVKTIMKIGGHYF
jgi:hypothetical protein